MLDLARWPLLGTWLVEPCLFQVNGISFLALTQAAEAWHHSAPLNFESQARQVVTLVEAGGPIYQLNVSRREANEDNGDIQFSRALFGQPAIGLFVCGPGIIRY